MPSTPTSPLLSFQVFLNFGEIFPSGPLIAEFPLDDISYFHDLVTISASNSQMNELGQSVDRF